MAAWLRRFGLHLAAAVGATGVFVAAAAVGANQTRQQTASLTAPPIATVVRTRTPTGRPKPQVVVATPSPQPVDNNAPQPPGASATQSPGGGQSQPTSGTQPAAPPRPATTPTARPERSLAGTIKDVQPDGSVDVVGVGGREWHVDPAPGALIRLNGKAARVDALQPGDGVVILGQAQSGPGLRFLAHAITARGK